MSIGMNISITNKMINFICILTEVRNINMSNIHFIEYQNNLCDLQDYS